MVYIREAALDMASGAYYEQLGQEYYLSPDKLESDYAPVRFARELRLFRRHCARGRVLDVGCSTGAFLYQLGQRFPGCYETIGTDASGPALDYAAGRGITVVTGDFLEESFGGKLFEAITFLAVMEHLAAPGAFLQKTAAILKPGGLCFVLVPNLRSLAVRLVGARYRYIYPQHLNYFNARTLGLLTAPLFETVELRTTHFNPIVIWQDWRRGGTEVSNPERGRLLKRTTGYKQNPWLWPVRMAYRGAEATLGKMGLADNLAVVLRKKG